MQFQVYFALLAMAVCFVLAAEESKPASDQSAATNRSKRGLIAAAAPLIASPYAAAPYVAAPYAAAPYVAAPYAAAPYAVASPYIATTPYAVASPYAASYVSPYTSYPYVAKTLASPYAYYR